MFITDEIYRDDGTQLGMDLPGGAGRFVVQLKLIVGTYALVGARIFNPSPQSKRVSMIVDIGNDFPSSTLASLNQLDCSILFRSTPERPTSRGYNLYGPGELRSTFHMKTKLTPQETSNI